MSDLSDEKTTDPVIEISTGWIEVLKAERVALVFGYMLLLVIAGYNIYYYLIKKRMYKSFSMTSSYSVLVLFSALSVFYEFWMGFTCGEHDCIIELMVNNSPEYREHFHANHKDNVFVIALIWKLRQ